MARLQGADAKRWLAASAAVNSSGLDHVSCMALRKVRKRRLGSSEKKEKKRRKKRDGPADPPFDHATGKGHVAFHRDYYDAI